MIEDYSDLDHNTDYEYEFFIHISLDGTKWWLPRYYKPEEDLLWTKRETY